MKFITHLIRNFRRWKQERDYRKSIRMTDYIGTYFVPATGGTLNWKAQRLTVVSIMPARL